MSLEFMVRSFGGLVAPKQHVMTLSLLTFLSLGLGVLSALEIGVSSECLDI